MGADPLGHRGNQRGLHVAGLDGGADPAGLEDAVDLGARLRLQVVDLRLDHGRAVEEVWVLEEVAFVGEDLLEAERPLLVPGPREAERLVPRRQLQRATAGVAAERDAERFEEDPPGVVLGLLFGEPQTVDLHAVAEAAEARVLDAVALAGDLVPELREGAHLRHLFDEANAGIDEKADAADDGLEALICDVPALTNLIEDADRVGEREGELLRRRRPGLLKVVAADVGGVPLRDLLQAVLVCLGDQPQARVRGKDVGAARQVLLDDVVLRRALQLRNVLATLPRQRHVEREHPHRRGVDGHGGVHLLKGDALEQHVEVVEAVDRHPDLAHLGTGERVIRGVAGLRGEVEGDREADLAGGEVGAVERVGGAGAGVPGVRAEDPRAVGGGVALVVVEQVRLARLVAHCRRLPRMRRGAMMIT